MKPASYLAILLSIGFFAGIGRAESPSAAGMSNEEGKAIWKKCTDSVKKKVAGAASGKTSDAQKLKCREAAVTALKKCENVQPAATETEINLIMGNSCGMDI